jgi:nitrite reductase (NADH) small subunit
MIGDDKGIPKVACPLHKKTFSLENGENLNGDIAPIATYPVKVEGEDVYIGFLE